MQDRYFGDIGDYAKFGLLRSFYSCNPAIRLGVLWYLVPDERNGDGRHIGYLAASQKTHQLYRTCDPKLYDVLGDLVANGSRTVALVETHRLLPDRTIYYSEVLSYRDVSKRVRPELRTRWLTSAHNAVATADVIFIDPDNGLETEVDRYTGKGPKYVYYDDLIPLATSGKSLIIYQHACRKGSFDDQIRSRLAVLREHLGVDVTEYFALRFRRISARAFLIVVAKAHHGLINTWIDTFISGPWRQHFELIRTT